MNRKNRVTGAPKVKFHGPHPLNSDVRQKGHEAGNAGVSHTLRGHNGVKRTRTP